MFGKGSKKFEGMLSSRTPWEALDFVLHEPEQVEDNLEALRPMVDAIRTTCRTKGWTDYLGPFLEKRASMYPQLLEKIKNGQDVTYDAALLEAYTTFLNLVKTMLKTGDSMDALARKKQEAKDAMGYKEERG